MQSVKALEDKVQPYLAEFSRQQASMRDICRRMGFIGRSHDPMNVRFHKMVQLLETGYRWLEKFRPDGIRFVQELQSANHALFRGEQQEKISILCSQLSGKLVAVFQSWDDLLRLVSEDPRVRRHNDLLAGKVEKHYAKKIEMDMAALCKEAAAFTTELGQQSLDFKVMAFGVVGIFGVVKNTDSIEGIADVFEELLEDLHDAELLTHSHSHHEELVPLEKIVRD